MVRYSLFASGSESRVSSNGAEATLPITCDVETLVTGDHTATSRPSEQFSIVVGGGGERITAMLLDDGPLPVFLIDGRPCEVVPEATGEYRIVGSRLQCRVGTGRAASRASATAADGLYAPMPGRVVKVSCREGDHVERGAALVVLEAMKMENELVAPMRGRVTKVLVTEGQAVEARAKLVALAEA
jgi:glutaconyl-CoA/methylmalonyl-CoA decarboxylase subunit gamma